MWGVSPQPRTRSRLFSDGLNINTGRLKNKKAKPETPFSDGLNAGCVAQPRTRFLPFFRRPLPLK
ncbi:hypothetical protein HMPREF9123_1404 [Neisseria bacilliformis ATCC BAA-1200]|uniref:Uncharacterized protein n=1 Tax=Neisseria bacilliformis ATCC BAA-1200 TaxID=888742 RepID=F2BC97_9NEIS|nr:hypothetical protein HMPREF9123_1404 [Neisseria bacilliformis ATCC BAA-1200]